MASQVTLRALGLNYSPNNLALPEGSLVVADDIIIRRDNVVESRRGYREYSQDFGIPEDRSKQLIFYKDRILHHYNDVLQYDTGAVDSNGKAIFEDFDGSYMETEDGLRVKSIEANKNLYFTTSKGIKKIAARTAADFTTDAGFIKDAGAVKAVNFYAELDIVQGQQAGFLGLDATVAYRVVWGYKDLNENLILGAPSDSIAVYNYLSSVCALDINALCATLDNLTQGTAPYTSVINNTGSGSFASAYYTPTSASAETMRGNVVSIATNIDRFSVLAIDSTVTPPPALPQNAIKITTIQLTSTEGIINFVGNDADKIFRTNDRIEIEGITASGLTSLNNISTRKFYTLTQVTSNQIRFNHNIDPAPTPVSATPPGATTKIFSYNYRNIVNTRQQDISAVGSPLLTSSLVDLVIPVDPINETYSTIYSAIYFIIAQLKADAAISNSLYISSALNDVYLQYLNVTAAANVKLSVNIPATIQNNTDYFFQIYRTANFTASNEQVLSALSPGNEMNLVYEAFPTAAERSALEAIIIDTYPEELRTANVPLYTNPASGEGILQANDIPPIAKDINVFKDVVFYANTKTRHRLTPFTLLGISNIVNGDKIMVSDGTTLGTTEYEFVTGLQEKTQFTFTGTVTDYANKYFTINSASDVKSYAIYYKLNNVNVNNSLLPPVVGNELTVNTVGNHNLSTGDTVYLYNFTPTGVNDDVIEGEYSITYVSPTSFKVTVGTVTSYTANNAFFIQTFEDKETKVVEIKTGDTPDIIKNKTITVLNSLVYDFGAESLSSGVMLVTNVNEGIVSSGYRFTVTSANATAGAVYKNSNEEKFTVLGTISGGTTLNTRGVISNVSSGVLTKISGIGDATISFSSVTNYLIGNISSPALSSSILQNGEGEDALNNKILLSQVASQAQAIDITTRSMISVINQNINSPINAYYASNADTLPGIINFESKTLLDVPFYIITAKTAVGSSFSPDVGPVNSPDQLDENGNPITPYITNVTPGSSATITTNGNHNLKTGDKIIITNAKTNSSINGIHTIIRTGPNTFTIPVNVTVVTSGIASWSKLSDTVVSSNEEKPNRIYYSKTLQPEAVPIGNSFDVGAADRKILRIFPLRDSLFVFKEDGLFRISGETIPFVRTLFDTSCVLVAPDSVAIANNIVYAWTNKGISNISEAGVTEISRPIDTEILKLASSNYTNFKKLTWGLGYDSDNSYTVYTNSSIADEYATIGFRFSNLTNTWTNIRRSQTCGVVNLKDDKIYSGSGTFNLIDQERKQFNRLDYADRDFLIDVTNSNILNNGELIRIVDVDDIQIGDVVTQEQKLTVYIYNSLMDKLDFDPTLSNNYSNIKINTGVNLRSAIVALANLLDTDLGITATDYFSSIADYNGNILQVEPGISFTTITTDGAHGLKTGRIVTIGGTNTNVVPSINGTYSITVTGANKFTIPVDIISGDSAVSPGIGLTYSTNPNIQKTDDIAACYNIIVKKLNEPPSGTTFKDYAQVNIIQLFEAVILSVDKKLNQFTVNLPLQWVVGEMQVYTSIKCALQYAPVTFQDPLKLKQVYEATMMFNNKAFTKGTASFSSDLKPEFFPIDFYGQGNGIFGHYSNPGFGFGFFGGLSNSAPFRTIIPRESQRCRYMNVRFSHSVARELWALYGITLTFNAQESTRAYR